MLTIEQITRYEEFKKLRAEWNATAAQSDSDIPFLSHEWFCSWWDVYGEGNEMTVLLARDGNTVRAIAPLMRTKMKMKGLPVKIISFMDNFSAARTGLIMTQPDPALFGAFLDAIKKTFPDTGMFMFNSVIRASVTDRIIRQVIQTRRMPYIELPGYVSPYITLKGTWDEYFNGRSKSFRADSKYTANQYARAGGFELVAYTRDNLAQAMEEVAAVSRKTWKYQDNTAISSDPKAIRFYTVLAHNMSAVNNLRIWILKLAGKPIAFSYNLEKNGISYGMKMGYDEDYRKMSPAKFLLTLMLKEYFAEGFTELDMLGQKDDFKLRWTSSCREHAKYIVFNNNFYGRALHWLKKTFDRVPSHPGAGAYRAAGQDKGPCSTTASPQDKRGEYARTNSQ